MEIGYNVNPQYVRLVPTWEAAARIFTQNLMYGVESDTKYTSAEELIKLGRQLDILQSSEEEEDTRTVGEIAMDSLTQSEGTVTINVIDDEWDCQP